MSGLPRGWVEVDLMEVIDLHDSIRIPLNKSERSSRVGPYPYYGANGLVDHVDDYLFDGEFVLLAEDGGNFDVPGKPVAYRVDGKFWVNNHAHILSAKDAIPAAFILHWCNNWNWMPFVGGTTRLKLTQEGMRKVRFPLPPLAEQKRIVAKLDALNATSARARTELARIETLVSRYKQAVLSKAFSGELTSAEVSNWASCTLGDLALDVRYGTAEKCTYAPNLTPVLRIPNVANGRVDLSDLKHASFNEKELKKLALLEGDLLIIRSNGSLDLVGRSAVVDAAAAGMLFAGYLIRIRLTLSKAMPSFIQYWMQSFAVRRTIEDAAKSTSGVNNVNSQQLQALKLKLPPIEEQHEIVRRIESAFAKIDRLAKEAKRALELVGRLDEAILAKAFRGELVPQDEGDEPAEHLLARIRAERDKAPKGERRLKNRA